MRIKITLPDELYAAIKAKAENNCRTLSQEICYVLSGSEWANVTHCGPQGDTDGHEENTNVSQEVDIKVGQCDPLVSQSDPEGDTMTHCGTEGDSSVPMWPNVKQSGTQGDTEVQSDLQEEAEAYTPEEECDFDALNDTPAPKVQTQAAEGHPPIDWDAVEKKAKLQSMAVKNNSGNTIGYLMNGQVVKEEDLPF